VRNDAARRSFKTKDYMTWEIIVSPDFSSVVNSWQIISAKNQPKARRRYYLFVETVESIYGLSRSFLQTIKVVM
jgi:hypothetical protein